MNRIGPFVVAELIGLMIFGSGESRAADYYVAQNGQTSAVPYTSWETAGSNIQTVVGSLTTYGDTVWVGPGTYGIPPSPYLYEGTNVVFINRNTSLRGSSGNPADTIIDAGGGTDNRGILVDTTDWHSNARYLISGFTVSNGYANSGGGIRFIFNNFVRTGIVENCVIESNTATVDGAGMHAYGTSTGPILIVSNTVVRNNTGGGLFNRSLDRSLFSHCQIQNNTKYGLYRYGGQTLIENCEFSGNQTIGGNYGGALQLWYGGTNHTIRNCLFHHNHFEPSFFGGAAIAAGWGVLPQIQNCTIVSNTATGGGIGGLYSHANGGCTNVLWNSIVYGNYRGTTHLNYGGGGNLFTNSCTYPITSFPAGANNINTDPLFVNPGASDFHLTFSSPCANTGANQAWMTGALDLDGNPRIDGAFNQVDMGCYEYLFNTGTLLMIR